LLITGIGTLVAVYGAGYLAGDGRRWRVFTLLLLFMLAMIGAVSSDHLLLLFVFWELTSVLSFLLVGFGHARESSRKAAQQALLITGTGGLFLLAGIILLAEIGGSYSLRQLIAAAPAIADDARLPAALTLLFVGAFSKSAQFPFHFWLPNAMAAPTPVSGYLHSATLVKLGIYLLRRPAALVRRSLRFIVHCILSGISTARIILRRRPARSGLVRLRTAPMSEAGAAVLAAPVTLTPGSSIIDIDPERREMLLHLLDLDDADGTVAGIRRDFEPDVALLFPAGVRR
jgi:NADH:ubiquinone oxidoreductase subunit 5 (subunit L)/multisubunit Na+/H+ antiporter MnhA subunit